MDTPTITATAVGDNSITVEFLLPGASTWYNTFASPDDSMPSAWGTAINQNGSMGGITFEQTYSNLDQNTIYYIYAVWYSGSSEQYVQLAVETTGPYKNVTISGQFYIQQWGSNYIRGQVNVRNNKTKTISGRANIRNAKDKTINGRVRVVHQYTADITGIVNVRNDEQKDIQGIVCVKRPGEAAIHGVVNVLRTENAEITGAAYIRIVVPEKLPQGWADGATSEALQWASEAPHELEWENTYEEAQTWSEGAKKAEEWQDTSKDSTTWEYPFIESR